MIKAVLLISMIMSLQVVRAQQPNPTLLPPRVETAPAPAPAQKLSENSVVLEGPKPVPVATPPPTPQPAAPEPIPPPPPTPSEELMRNQQEQAMPTPAPPNATQPNQELAPEPAMPQPLMSPSMEAFTYDPTGKRDPFLPDLPREQIPEAKSGEGEIVERPLDPLERFDLAQLRVAAIIWATKNPRALIVDPNKKVHYVKLQSRMGLKNGYVAGIREREVVVVEFTEENGQTTKAFKVLELR